MDFSQVTARRIIKLLNTGDNILIHRALAV